MKSTAAVLLGSRLLASFPVEWEPAPVELHGSDIYQRPSVAFFCPECGETWARFILEGRPFVPLRRRCLTHAKFLPWLDPWADGSLIAEYYTAPLLEQAPIEFWQFEARTALTLADKLPPN